MESLIVQKSADIRDKINSLFTYQPVSNTCLSSQRKKGQSVWTLKDVATSVKGLTHYEWIKRKLTLCSSRTSHRVKRNQLS